MIPPGLFRPDDDYWTGPPITDEVVRRAEARLNYRLPAAYVAVLKQRNGGSLRRSCCPTDFPTSWAADHFDAGDLLGIGEARDAIDGEFGSSYMIREWGYPDIGVVIFVTPSAGHDTVMLDYTDSGPQAEPAVAYIDEDRVPRRVAPSFEAFLARLVRCPD